MNNTIKRTWNQGSMVNIEDLRGMTFQAESGAHTFVISAVDANNNPITLSGTPSGTMLRPDNTDQALTCSVSGGKVYATLPAGCYDVPGRAGITIFLTSGGQKAAIYAAVVSVTRTQSGIASPGTTASVVDLVNAINTAISGIPATDTALKAAMAPTYSNSALYAVGEYAWYNGTLYRCTTAITTAETWTYGHWTAAAIGTDSANGLRELKSAIIEMLREEGYYDKMISDTGAVVDNEGTFVSPFIEASAQQFTWNTGKSINGKFVLYNINKSKLEYFSNNGAQRTVNASGYTSMKYFRATFSIDMIGDAYVLDANGNIVFAGGWLEKILTNDKINDKAIDCKYTFVEKTNGQKNTMYELFGSSTDNVLDTGNVIKDIFFDGNGFVKTPGAIISRLIPLREARQVTISGYTASQALGVAFLTDVNLTIKNSNYYYGLSNTSRTINVPLSSKYMVILLDNPKASAHDYSGMKASLTGSSATGIYTPVYLGNAFENELDRVMLVYDSKTKNLLDTSKYFTSFRISDSSPYIFSNTNGSIVSHPIYVKGCGKVVLKSTAVCDRGRFVLFTKDLKLNADSIQSVAVGFTAQSTTDEKISVVSVPAAAVWMYLTLTTGGTTSAQADDNWKDITVCYGGETPTTDVFVQNHLIAVGDTALTEVNSLDYENIKRDEERDFIKRWIPYVMSTPHEYITADDYYNCINLLFATDQHIDHYNAEYNLKNVEDMMRFRQTIGLNISGFAGISACLFGGDFITPFGTQETVTKAEAKARASKFFNILKEYSAPCLVTKGNHDLNDWDNPPSEVLTDADFGSLWFNYAETQYGIVRQTRSSGVKSPYFYWDFPNRKMRVISVDTQDCDKTTTNQSGDVLNHGGMTWYISNEQMNWLINTALNFDDKPDKGWGVIVLLHQSFIVYDHSRLGQWYASKTYLTLESAIEKFFNVCKAFNTQSTYSVDYTFPSNTSFNLSIDADFTRYASETNKPYMICWLMGHEHTDYYEKKDGINMIWTAQQGSFMQSSDARIVRLPGSYTQNCFDMMNIDFTKRKLRMFRFGAGENCYGEGGDRFLPDGIDF